VSPARNEPISRTLKDRGLAEPALLLLEAHRPLRPLLGLAATALLPIVRPLIGERALRIQQALDDDAGYDALLGGLREEAER
jgi:hypothetical protein